MPHVPAELKERLKREVSIQRLAEARGIKLVRKGRSLMGLCPFHADHNPSLSIDTAKNEWNCLGACGEGGDVIKWVMRSEGISFNHAIELLKRNSLPAAAASSGPPPKQCTVVKEVLVGEDTLTIRHSIPIPSGPPQDGGSETANGQNYLLCKGRDLARPQ